MLCAARFIEQCMVPWNKGIYLFIFVLWLSLSRCSLSKGLPIFFSLFSFFGLIYHDPEIVLEAHTKPYQRPRTSKIKYYVLCPNEMDFIFFFQCADRKKHMPFGNCYNAIRICILNGATYIGRPTDTQQKREKQNEKKKKKIEKKNARCACVCVW